MFFFYWRKNCRSFYDYLKFVTAYLLLPLFMKHTDSKPSSSSFPIVVIGAASGGYDAMSLLLQHLPRNTGMAYVYIQHPDGEPGALPERLAEKTPMPVAPAGDDVALQPDHIYVVPNEAPIILADGRFAIDGDDNGHALLINRFFSSVAENYKDIAIGVLLSGGDGDGAIGLKAIKMAGGITFVQDGSAKFQSMSRNAVAEGVADFVLPPDEIAAELSRLGMQKETWRSAISDLDSESPFRDEDLGGILHLLSRSTGVDFSQYKDNTIRRRILRRMMLFKLATVGEYAQYMRQHTQEISALYRDLLINVTTFFRDAGAVDYLKTEILPKLLKAKQPNDPVRIWVPACSTGQEPYSMAMLIMESLGENATAVPVQIFATDLSEVAVNKARLGLYSKDEVADVSPKRLQRFFTKVDGHYRIIKPIRDLCIFATHNLAKDPPFSRLDIVSCCNLLIYLDTALQKKVIATFHYSLVSHGYLILGKSETVGSSAYLFGQVEKKHKIYSKKKDTSSKALFQMNYNLSEQGKTLPPDKQWAPQKKHPDEVDLEKTVDLVLLKNFAPASVLVNADLDILQFRGSTGLYLEPSPGRASLNLMKMARPGLGFELRNIVHKTKRSGQPSKKEGLEIMADGKPQLITVQALPIKGDGDEDYFLVVFEALPPSDETRSGESNDARVQQLEAEITGLREDMRSIVEAQEAANEELQSANEEVVSSNEELQSINEELETSREEIESSNEELITMNQELQIRNEQLAEAQEYGEAVFTTIREGLLIIDKDLRIKTANRSFYKTFGLSEEQVEGRLLYDLDNRQWNIPKLRQLLEDVIPENAQFHGFELRHTFPGIGEKVLLLNARRLIQRIHGQQLILLAIEDITGHKQAERIIAEQEAIFHNMADNAPVMIWLAGIDALCLFANKAFNEFRGHSLEASIGRPWYQSAHPDDEPACIKIFKESFTNKAPFEITYRLQHRDGGYRTILSHAKPNFNTGGEFIGYIGSCVEMPGGQPAIGNR